MQSTNGTARDARSAQASPDAPSSSAARRPARERQAADRVGAQGDLRGPPSGRRSRRTGPRPAASAGRWPRRRRLVQSPPPVLQLGDQENPAHDSSATAPVCRSRPRRPRPGWRSISAQRARAVGPEFGGGDVDGPARHPPGRDGPERRGPEEGAGAALFRGLHGLRGPVDRARGLVRGHGGRQRQPVAHARRGRPHRRLRARQHPRDPRRAGAPDGPRPVCDSAHRLGARRRSGRLAGHGPRLPPVGGAAGARQDEPGRHGQGGGPGPGLLARGSAGLRGHAGLRSGGQGRVEGPASAAVRAVRRRPAHPAGRRHAQRRGEHPLPGQHRGQPDPDGRHGLPPDGSGADEGGRRHGAAGLRHLLRPIAVWTPRRGEARRGRAGAGGHAGQAPHRAGRRPVLRAGDPLGARGRGLLPRDLRPPDRGVPAEDRRRCADVREDGGAVDPASVPGRRGGPDAPEARRHRAGRFLPVRRRGRACAPRVGREEAACSANSS